MRNNLYSKEQLETIIKTCYSYAEVLRKLEKRQTGGNQSVLKRYIERYQIDISHFTGQRWQINKTSEEIARRKMNTILRNNTNYKSFYLKKRLIESELKENKCEICGIGKIWNNKPITLELHHINGDHYDNRLENLQILCPNCHSQTNNFRNRNHNKRVDIPNSEYKLAKVDNCKYCGKEFRKSKDQSKFCSRECYISSLKEETLQNSILTKENILSKIGNYNTLTELSQAFNISRPTMRKYLDHYNLLNAFKNKYDFHAKPILQYDSNGILVKEWPSITDAINTLKIYSIERVCCFKQKSAGGYIWRYKENQE